jgi:hypothetical protein
MQFRSRYGTTFYIVMIALMLVLVIAAISNRSWLMGVTLLGMALVAWIFPFATPQTVATLGVQKSMAAVRVGAGVLAGLGLWYLIGRW